MSRAVVETGAQTETAPAGAVLEVEDLKVAIRSGARVIQAVDGVTFDVRPGETVGVLGESGSGKSVTARAIMGLRTGMHSTVSGSIRLEGRELLTMSDQDRRSIRGRRIAMIFQDALSALNPVLTVGAQIAEVYRIHEGMDKRAAFGKAVEMLDLVRVPDARRRVNSYPHEFSGGMRQRAMIAMALALNPSILIADEPTTALDVTVQAQVMDLLMEMTAERQMALLLITHDMGVVADVADRIVVMYAGRVMERAGAAELHRRPAHPYAEALLASVPRPGQRGTRLAVIPGSPPDLSAPLRGCAFSQRCSYTDSACEQEPPLLDVAPGRFSRCHHWQEVYDA